jgi:hypothetical protein
MIKRLFNDARAANILSIIAVILAAGTGGAVAATKLAKNSVGEAQIRPNAVHSKQIKDHAVLYQDINPSARTRLRGKTGPQGPAGAPGTNAIEHFAAMSASGSRLAGDSKGGGTAGAIGAYTVDFGVSVASCVAVATPGTQDASPAPAGAVRTNHPSDTVIGVQVTDAAGNPANLPFTLVLACPN